MEKEHSCRYSKAMNQPYPRLCVECGKQESRPLSNLEERFKRDMSMVVMPLDNENIPEEGNMITDWLDKHGDPKILEQVEQEWKQIEQHSYLQGFIDQFGTGVLGELDPKEWDALQFLEWLKLNNYEIIKKK